MPIHPPKHISSTEGIGFNTIKDIDFKDENTAVGTETWQPLEKPWAEGDTIIAEAGYKWVTKWEVGKSYVITKFFNTQNILVGIYCDISRPVEKIEGGFMFDDLYLDVWQVPGQDPTILDEDELKEAVDAGYVTQEEAERATEVALKLQEELRSNPDLLSFK